MKDREAFLSKYVHLLAACCFPAYYAYMLFKDPVKLREMMARYNRRRELERRHDEVSAALMRMDARLMATLSEPTANEMLEEEYARHYGMCYGYIRAMCDISEFVERHYKAWYKAYNEASRCELVLSKRKYSEAMMPIFYKEMK